MKIVDDPTITSLPDKPLLDLPFEDRPFLTGPSVESYLDQIRKTLALVATYHAGAPSAYEENPELFADSHDALRQLTESAWTSARELAEGLPGGVHNLHVRSEFTRRLSPAEVRAFLAQNGRVDDAIANIGRKGGA